MNARSFLSDQSGVAFLSDQSGVAAIELALVLPLMVAGWLGMAQLAQINQVSDKVHLTAQSLSDLATQKTTPTLSNLVTAAQQMLSPLASDSSVLTIDMVGVAYNASGTASQSWRCSSPGGLSSAVSLTSASGLGSTSQGVIMVTVTYAYTPTITGGVIGAQSFSATGLNTTRLGGLPSKPC